MSSIPDMSENPEIIHLQGSMTIPEACEFREILLAHLPRSGDAVIDLGELTEIDMTGLQLLCAAHRTMKNRQGDIHLAGPLPEAIQQAVRASGLDRARSCGSEPHETCLWANGAEDE